ncbi:Multidrug resistance transporter, Bcr/CflA family [Serinicoccus hydrothermalis]|uniref:Multidrug resistance transporter, Bcr/CflA family n=1 Tax=Serinicoccus hydrothermalis TaxID=1758689 RepID=A0A1B1NGR2_9MICO|nr:multidrug effflux MFS transporter [Serinicoccus hydrothermalis]ANS80591.1 Multidrug resistance transporter, Bcr/CflA family [Serinicoccus hydrothermalis]
MSSAPVEAPAAPGHPRTEPSPLGRLLLFGALVAIGPLTIDMYLAAFPAVVEDLSTTEATVQLTLTATLVGLASGQLLIGALSDSFGRRRPLIASLTVYVLVSVAIAVSSSIELLLVLRFVQGLTGAAGMVLSQAMVRDLYSGSRMATFISRLFLVVGVAPILAPTLGAQFLIFGSWRTIFWALGAFGLLLAVLALVLVKETLPPERRRHFGPRTLWSSYRVLLSDRRYIGLVLTVCTAMGCLFAYISSATFVFQGVYGMTTQQYAFVFAAGAGALTVTSQVNGSLVRTVHPASVMRVALPSMLAIALALLTAALVDLGVWAIVGGIVLLMGSVGFVMPNSPSIALADHGERAGAAAALLGATNFVFGALISPLSGLFGVGSAVPMAAIMVVCATASLFFFTVLARPREILRDMPWE